MNISQIQNQYLTFTANNLVRLIKSTSDFAERERLLTKYFNIVNKTQGEFLIGAIHEMSTEEQEEFYNDIFENGICIHQSSFFDNMSFEDFLDLFKEFPEICQKYKCKGIEQPLVMGQMYFIRLMFSRFLLNCGEILRA